MASTMPSGKMQFGIIVKTETHKRAKILAAEFGTRISDVYASGVERIWEEQQAPSNPADEPSKGFEKRIMKGLSKESLPYFEALAGFLRKSTDTRDREILEILLKPFLPGGNRSRFP